MTATPTIDANAKRAALLRAAMLRMVRAKGRFRGAVLARLAHAIGRAKRHIPAFLGVAIANFLDILTVPLSALADLGLGQAGGGGGGSGQL